MSSYLLLITDPELAQLEGLDSSEEEMSNSNQSKQSTPRTGGVTPPGTSPRTPPAGDLSRDSDRQKFSYRASRKSGDSADGEDNNGGAAPNPLAGARDYAEVPTHIERRPSDLEMETIPEATQEIGSSNGETPSMKTKKPSPARPKGFMRLPTPSSSSNDDKSGGVNNSQAIDSQELEEAVTVNLMQTFYDTGAFHEEAFYAPDPFNASLPTPILKTGKPPKHPNRAHRRWRVAFCKHNIYFLSF